ncbi:MAG: TolC family protein [Bryobacterales bacterium]|nr:TolC family protein [Bryobacterales bacterium]
MLRPYAITTAGNAMEGNAVDHPLLALRAATISSLSSDAALAQREWLPKIALYSSVSGRGTGARNNGDFRDGAAGLYPDTGNWALGVGFTVDLFDWKRFRNRKEVRDHRVEEARSNETEASIALRAIVQQARVSLETARAIAPDAEERTSKSGEELLTQSSDHYRTGYGAVTDVADHQDARCRSQVNDLLAKVRATGARRFQLGRGPWRPGGFSGQDALSQQPVFQQARNDATKIKSGAETNHVADTYRIAAGRSGGNSSWRSAPSSPSIG